MAKGKSSASSGTRKKHARKAAGGAQDGVPQLPKDKKVKGKEKGKKGKEVRKKVYIAPVKPAPARPDPLDTLGIAQVVPAELLVVLRRLAKKDSVTKRRALEDFQADWTETAKAEEWRLSAVVDALPVWLHHVPSLFLHPSRRIRYLAVTLHSSILKLPSPVPERLFAFLRDVADADQAEYIVGTWCMAAFDVDRQVASYARDSWTKCTVVSTVSEQDSRGQKLHLSDNTLCQLWDLVYRSLLDPSAIYMSVNPPQPVAPPPPPGRKGVGGRTSQPTVNDDDLSGRTKGEEDEENEEDRAARLRIGAFGAAQWLFSTYLKAVLSESANYEEIFKSLDNPALWSALYHAPEAPFVQDQLQAFGFNQPGVRRAAWSFLSTVVQSSPGHLAALLPTLSRATLRSAWIEPDSGVRSAMWQPLMLFLKGYPSSWQLAATSAVDGEDDSGSDDDEEPPNEITVSATVAAQGPSIPYQEFRQFLELGCMGTPTQGYPAVLVVLSTIPSSVLASVSSPIQTLFTSFWAAVDGRALSGLDRAAASAALMSSVLECSVFMSRRLLSDDGEALLGDEEEGDLTMTARTLMCDQVNRAWEEIVAQRLKVDEKLAAEYLARTLRAVTQIDEGIADGVWDALVSSIRNHLRAKDQPIPTLLSSVVKVFGSAFPPDTKLHHANNALTEEIVRSILSQIEQTLGEETGCNVSEVASSRLGSFVSVLDTFGSELFGNAELVSGIDETVYKTAYRLLIFSPRILRVYFAHRGDDERRSSLWHALLHALAEHPEELSASLSALLDIATEGNLSAVLRPSADELDNAVSRLLLASSQGANDSVSLTLLQRLLENPDPFISRECFTGVSTTICATFSQHVNDCLHGHGSATSVDGLLSLLRTVARENVLATMHEQSVVATLRDIFVFAYVIPSLSTSSGLIGSLDVASLWDNGLAKLSESMRLATVSLVKNRLQGIIADCTVPIRLSTFVEKMTNGIPHFGEEMFGDVVLSQTKLDDTLNYLPGQSSGASLAVIDPLAFPGVPDEPNVEPETFDQTGFSSYARMVSTLLLYFLQDRDLARENIWALRHFYALKVYATDVLDVPFATSPVFAEHTARGELLRLIRRVDQIAAYLLAEDYEQGWLSQVASRLGQTTVTAAQQSTGVEALLRVLIHPHEGSGVYRKSRILRLVLQHLFSNASKQDAEQFVTLARKIGNTAPHASIAITFSVTQYAPEPPMLDRLRNELAATMFGIPASRANTEGLWTLRRLAAVAPDPESDVVFLPTPRAVNVVKACQQWITSDEDLDEEVDSEMTCVFLHLAPILQNVPGSHWDLIYDVVENNLENCSFEEESTLPLLSRTLKLIIAIEDLTSTNRSLRGGWDDRRSAILTMVRDLVAKKPSDNAISTPLSVCRELALTIVQDLPQSLIGNDTLSKMCHLVTDASAYVPQMAYKMLREAANKRTEYLVVEASVESDETIPLDLPAELIQLVQNSFLDEDVDASSHNHSIFGYLLTWMLVFDLFTNASLKVKSGYMDHLRREDLVTERFLPHIFSILRLYGGSAKAVKLDIWEVDEFYLELYSTETPIGLSLLAAHLYYRALLLVPSLIRNWLLDCRDRQLSGTVTSYTSTHFSPAIIRAELAQVKDPSLAAELSDETFTVKVANAVSEITAAFAVDEYSLELKLKLPPDFPLHTIITKDSNRVGVTEDRWRSWILGVQQILTFRSGSILDGLAFFKKNVTSHFEGQSECAICYSMISAMDGTLPKKPCKTCKNRFHAGCLYKWFNSSHSSSCPLCRSEIIQ